MLNCQESTTILNACKKKVWKLIEGTTYMAITSDKQAKSHSRKLRHGYERETLRGKLNLF